MAAPAPRAQPGDGPAQGITWSSENELTRPLRSLDIDRRIDYVYVTSRKKDGRGTIHDCRVVLDASASDGDLRERPLRRARRRPGRPERSYVASAVARAVQRLQ